MLTYPARSTLLNAFHEVDAVESHAAKEVKTYAQRTPLHFARRSAPPLHDTLQSGRHQYRHLAPEAVGEDLYTCSNESHSKPTTPSS